MRLELIAAGIRMPDWVDAGFEEYRRRLPPTSALGLTEVPLGTRGKGRSAAKTRAGEAERILAAIPSGAWVVALDERGAGWSTRELARQLDRWRHQGRDVALLIGGPDGLGAECLERADQRWSLSSLTLPHALVRVVIAEQLYRAWSLLGNHPYHRE